MAVDWAQIPATVVHRHPERPEKDKILTGL